ncbi:MAG: 5-(carboxyamino)imidazole ribonucleotide mutase [Thermomicrobiales bacterium]|nr:5-(carboxyamino)imidazole ribonucleotide mutase [Thermomicrobiales bacterium]MEA2524473.1 5-(carboxyamino)imidazole ribonucleotide mutase [Thermomicrobiales bacterium]MEA2595592.1 5-(carboxyamino)imidazole ribonucleotide mutase [Thermomicrobiales bacterium]
MTASEASPLVGVVMGSDSDLPTMRAAVDALTEFGVPCEVRILSAHRTPDEMLAYARAASGRGLKVVIAGAGGAAHLPGMIAAATPLPVIGVPVAATQLAGFDALLSIVQMPAGVPVATVAIGNARNAGLLAVRILAAADPILLSAMERFQGNMAETVRAKDARVRQEFTDPQGSAKSAT